MCGLIVASSTSKIDSGLLAHRGPDEFYEYIIGKQKFAFFRLAITGGFEGSSPILSADKKWQIFLNGEIYNFKSLINSFNLPYSNSDSQVLIDGVAKYGVSFIGKARGMFAGFIVSLESKKVYCFRDPLGEKPLFSGSLNGEIYFSSEVTALAKIMSTQLTIDSFSVANYFQLGYIEEPRTIFKEIKSVDRGVIFEIDFALLKLNKIATIDITNYPENHLDFSDLIETVVKEQSYYSGDASILLSSGVDSSTLFKMLSKYRTRLTSYVYAEPVNRNEIEWIKALIFSLGNGYPAKITLPPFGHTSFLNQMLEVSIIFDQPHSDSASFAYLNLIKKMHKANLRVMYVGHGPDEFFWGYSPVIELYNSIGTNLRKKARYYWDTPANCKQITSAINNEFMDLSNFSLEYPDPYLDSDVTSQKLKAEVVHSYLAHNGLRQIDRLAMSHSIEPRNPFADSRIYAWSQFNDIKPKMNQDKYFFRKFSSSVISPRVAYRTKKGFSTSTLWKFKDEQWDASSALDFLYSLEIPWQKKLQSSELDTRTKFRLYNFFTWIKFHF